MLTHYIEEQWFLHTAAFFTYGILGWTEELIKREMQESGDEMAKLMQMACK